MYALPPPARAQPEGQAACQGREHARPDRVSGEHARTAQWIGQRLGDRPHERHGQDEGGKGEPACSRAATGRVWGGRGHRRAEDTLTIGGVVRRYTRAITTPAAARSPRDGARPFVSLLTDWGLRDPSAAICRGIILGVAPDALIVDISHEIDKFNIRQGALMLWSALPYLPVGAHVAVVDPGVGTERRAIALETVRGDHLVGPDNGLLLPAAERLGGATRAHLIENAQYLLPATSATFHGRDVFAPAAAHLALGVPLDHIGPAVDIDELVSLDWPVPGVADGRLATSVVYVDTFGNIKLSALGSDAHAAFSDLATGDRLVVAVGVGERPRRRQARWARTFGDAPAGELLLYEDSYGRLCLARNQGSAAAALRITNDVPVLVTRASGDAPPEDDQAAG
jgi:S-adenosylmethionine hydrolase